ncbi:MAG: hypothetical protein IOC69_02925 [Aestuariivirga sp.]|nr:hypothetical protein [Aestuariivirga sp.]
MAKPLNPHAVLAAAVILPGAGHVLLGKAQRGLMFLFFTVILGWVSLRLTPETASFFTRHAGGILIYGFSVIDAYKTARIEWEMAKFSRRKGEAHLPPDD